MGYELMTRVRMKVPSPWKLIVNRLSNWNSRVCGLKEDSWCDC